MFVSSSHRHVIISSSIACSGTWLPAVSPPFRCSGVWFCTEFLRSRARRAKSARRFELVGMDSLD